MIRHLLLVGVLSLLSATHTSAQNAVSMLSFEQKAAGLKFLRSTFDPSIAGGPDQEYVRTFDLYFGRDPGPEHVSALSTQQRSQLLELAMLANWAADDLRYLRLAQLIMEEMVRRGEATRAHSELLVHELQSKRQFAAAARLADLTGLPGLPNFTIDDFHSPTARSPTTLRLTHNAHRLARAELDTYGRAKVVVLSTPTCPYCRSAAKAISNDAFLKRFFAQHSEWVLPTNASFEYDALIQWTQTYPHLQHSLMFDAAEWPAYYGVATAPTPTFFIFDNGTLRTKLAGWPDDEAFAKHRLLTALAQAGHIPAEIRPRPR